MKEKTVKYERSPRITHKSDGDPEKHIFDVDGRMTELKEYKEDRRKF